MHQQWFCTKNWVAAMVLLLLTGVSQASQPGEPTEGATSAETFVLVAQIRAELELLREEMGKPEDSQQIISVQNAAPREVYYQAITLFEKANQLSFEQVRERSPSLVLPEGGIQSSHVKDVVEKTLSRLRAVKSQLDISTVIKSIPLKAGQTPTHIYIAIEQANRQLNVLLDQRFAPKDVYQQVSLAIGYTARILVNFPTSTRIPSDEPLQHGKIPAEVLRRLVSCYSQIRSIFEHYNLDMLSLNVNKVGLALIAPSDVYDMASLLVSELAYLHTQFPEAIPPRAVYDPGRKFPSHVYQRVGILEKQLGVIATSLEPSKNALSSLALQKK